MDNKKQQVRRYSEFELKQPLGKDSVLEAGNSTRVFESGPAWFRLQQLIEDERKRHVLKITQGNPNATTMHEVNFVQGFDYAMSRIYDYFDKIVQEGAKERE